MTAVSLIALRWGDVDWRRADMAVTRLKNGKSTRQPLDATTCAACVRFIASAPATSGCFMSERGPFTRDGFAKALQAAADRD